MDYILKEDKNWNIKAVILCISPIMLEKYIKKLENEPFITALIFQFLSSFKI